MYRYAYVLWNLPMLCYVFGNSLCYAYVLEKLPMFYAYVLQELPMFHAYVLEKLPMFHAHHNNL